MASPLSSQKPADPRYGQGEYSIAEEDLPPDVEELLSEVHRVVRAPSYKPPMLPRVATEVMGLAQDPTTPLEKMVQVLGSDPVLAGRLLSRVNSAGYCGQRPLRSLKEAVVRLGMKTIRDVVLETAMTMRVFRSPQYQPIMERLRDHCVFTAELARKVCHYTSVDAEYAFLAGLLHDVGIAGILLVLGELKRSYDPLVLWVAIDRAHGEAGETMATQWGLPQELGMVIRAHHEVEIARYPHPLAAAVAVADALATELGTKVSDTGGDATPPRKLALASQVLGLDEKRTALLRKDAEKLRAAA